MTKTISPLLKRKLAQRELFVARQALTHLVNIYNSGEWRLYYKTDLAFAAAIREKRKIFDHWNSVVGDDSANSAGH